MNSEHTRHIRDPSCTALHYSGPRNVNCELHGRDAGDVVSDDVECLQPERCSGQAKAANARIARARSRWYCLMQRLMLMRPVGTGYRVHAALFISENLTQEIDSAPTESQ